MFTLACMSSCAASLLFIYSKMPLALTIYLSLNAVATAVVMLSYMKSSWFSFILMIVFLSGIIVVFTYVSSLSSNEFTPPSTFSIFSTTLLILSITLYSIIIKEHPLEPFLSSNKQTINISQAVILHKLYEKDSIAIISMIITYLLVALLVVVKNSALNTAPLRSVN